MKPPAPEWLGLIFGLSELGLSLLRRSGGGTQTRDDRGSLRLIWTVIVIAMAVAVLLSKFVPQARMPMTAALYMAGFATFCAGLLLRWYSILYLGKYFTVDVAIAADHRVIDRGPYRFIRHPSYTGVLLGFLGLSLCTGNWASMIVLMTAVSVVFMRRIHIEEHVLQTALGQPYVDYMRRTKRLIPFIY